MEAALEVRSEAMTQVVVTPDSTWMPAAKAARLLQIRRRDVLCLIQQGAIERRVEGGQNLYRIPIPDAERAALLAQLPKHRERSNRHTALEAIPMGPETHNGPAAKCSATTGDHEAIQSLSDSDDALVFADHEIEEIDIEDHDLVVVEDISLRPLPQELVATNLELTRLVDVTLQRFDQEAGERVESFKHLRETMRNLQQVQQCLSAWQHHAASLQRSTLQSQHLTARALDLADEVLEGRWIGSRRRRDLRERLGVMRAVTAHLELDELPSA